MCFSVNFAKFLRMYFLQNAFRRLLLKIYASILSVNLFNKHKIAIILLAGLVWAHIWNAEYLLFAIWYHGSTTKHCISKCKSFHYYFLFFLVYILARIGVHKWSGLLSELYGKHNIKKPNRVMWSKTDSWFIQFKNQSA